MGRLRPRSRSLSYTLDAWRFPQIVDYQAQWHHIISLGWVSNVAAVIELAASLLLRRIGGGFAANIAGRSIIIDHHRGALLMSFFKTYTTMASILAGTVLLIGGNTNSAMAQQTQEYRGIACIIFAGVHCPAEGWNVGDCALMRFSPPNALGNGDRTSVSLKWTSYAQNYQVNESAIGTTFKDVQFSWVGRNGGIASTATKMRIPAVAPANFSTQGLQMIVDFQRFSDFSPGDPSFCFAKFRFTGQKYPDQVPASAPANEETGFSPDLSHPEAIDIGEGFGNSGQGLD